MKEHEMGEECSLHGIDVNCKQHFCQKPKGKKLLGRCVHEWEKIKMDIKEVGQEGMDLIHLTVRSINGFL
jgi:hypothetical protein